MAEQSQIDIFVEWTKARLDEMSAAAKALEQQIHKLDDQYRADAEQVVEQVRKWVTDGEVNLQKAREQGDSALAEARTNIEKNWAEFQVDFGKWVEIAENQRATFEAQAKAQLDAWNGMFEAFRQRAAAAQQEGQATAEAEFERLKGEAAKAEAQLEQVRKAGEASWTAMSKGLEESRAAFEKASKEAWDAFNRSMKQ